MDPLVMNALQNLTGKALAVALVLCLLSGCQKAIETHGKVSFLIENVRVFDGEILLHGKTVLVVGDKIEKVGEGFEVKGPVEVIDGRGCTLIPGLFDTHVHVGNSVEGPLNQSLVFGVTTVVDMFSAGERMNNLLNAEAENRIDLASVVVSGTGATAPSGHPSQMNPEKFPTIDSPDKADEFVNDRINEGSRFLKIIYDDLEHLGFGKPSPMISKETLKALIEAAHEKDLLAIVHIGTESQARDAIEAGADGLAHMFTGETITGGFGELVKKHGGFVIPTLSTLHSTAGQSEGPDLMRSDLISPYLRPRIRQTLAMKWRGPPVSLEATKAGMKQLLDAGATILAGTDSPIPGTTYGASLHGELELLTEYGLTPTEVLKSATSLPARVFGLQDRGRIAEGMTADLVLVEGDPTVNILDTRKIREVWKSGKKVERKTWTE